MRGPWICIPQLLNDTGAAWEIGFITPATDRTITPWLILVPTPSFLFSLMPNISLCSLCSSLLLHFLNVILCQNTSDKHIDFTKSNVCFYRFPTLGAFLLFSLFRCVSHHALDDVFRVGENCFYFAAVDQRLCRGDAEDEVLWKEPRCSPLHGAFLG